MIFDSSVGSFWSFAIRRRSVFFIIPAIVFLLLFMQIQYSIIPNVQAINPANNILILHKETSQTPNNSYQMFAVSPEGSGITTSTSMQPTITFYTKNDTSSTITIFSGNWTASLRYASKPVPDSIPVIPNLIYYFQTLNNNKTPDSSSNARDLSVPTNSSAPTFGVFGQHVTNAFSFDGINDFLYGPSSLTSNVDDIKAGPDTTSGWFKYAGTNNNNKKVIYRVGNSHGGDYYEIALGNGTTVGHGKLFFSFQTTNTPGTNPPQGNCFTISSNLENGNWQHFAAVRDGDFTCRIYINGTLNGIPDTIGCPVCTGVGDNTVDASGPAEIARSSVSGVPNYFQGNIDEIFHWNNYSLTSTQALALYNANYGAKAHTIVFKIDKTDSTGTVKNNIKTDTRYLPFFDTRATNSFNKIINYTTNVSSNQIFGSGDRLKFTIIWQSGLNMTLRLDDSTLSNPITSFLQTPPLAPGFPTYNNGGTNGTDITPPVVTGNLSRLPNSNNWYNAPVTVTWVGTDASGIASCDSPTTYSGPSGTSIFIIGHCTDNAGNVGTGSVTIDYDSTPPTLVLPIIEVKTHNPLGTTVSYNITATDNIYSPISTSSKKYSTAILFGSTIPSNDTVKMLLKYYNSTDYIPDYKNAPRFSLFPNQTSVLVSPSLTDMQNEINLAKNFTFKPNILAYDIENWQYTPQQEQNNPAQSINQAADMAHNSGYQFGTTPGASMITNIYQSLNWTKIEFLVIQFQSMVSNISYFTSNTNQISNFAKSENPSTQVLVQVDPTLSTPDQIIHAIDSVRNSSTDGVAILWHSSVSNSDLEKLVKYIKLGWGQISCSPSSGSIFSPGNTTVTCSVIDMAGNSVSNSFAIQVNYTNPLSIIPPTDITVQAIGNLTTVNVGVPSVIDSVDPSPIITSNATVQFPVGTSIVIWTATDSFGNIASANQQVVVLPPQKLQSTVLLNKVSSISWGQNVTISGLLQNANGSGIAAKLITINGTGVTSVLSIITNSTGGFSVSGTSPNTVSTGWTYQGHFAGDSLYQRSDSFIQSYNTTKHNAALSSLIQPNPVTHGTTYKISGVLKDSVTGSILSSKTILFKADSPIVIASAITDSSGKFVVSSITAPSTTGSYRIQAKFNGDSLYNSATSSVKTLTVS